MNVYTIRVEGTGDVFRGREDLTVLEAMERFGGRGVAVGCRGGGCGACRVEIVEGRWGVVRPMSRGHVSEEDERAGRVLACGVRPQSDLRIRVTKTAHP